MPSISVRPKPQGRFPVAALLQLRNKNPGFLTQECTHTSLVVFRHFSAFARPAHLQASETGIAKQRVENDAVDKFYGAKCPDRVGSFLAGSPAIHALTRLDNPK